MKQRTILITGASGDIGKALCSHFSNQGWFVIASDKDENSDAVYDKYIQIDLAALCVDDNYRNKKINEICLLLPTKSLNALVNNAATQILAPFRKLGAEQWHETINVNVIAPALLVKSLLANLEADKGSVVNISSIHATLTKPEFSAYATSKAGLLGLTRSLAVELGGQVRVNAICPAAIFTEMLKKGFAGNPVGFQSLVEYHPSKSIGTPREVAEIAHFLVSQNSTFISGVIFGLDGGISSRLHDYV